MGVTPKLNGTVDGTAVYLPFDYSQLQNMGERDVAYMQVVTREGWIHIHGLSSSMECSAAADPISRATFLGTALLSFLLFL
jgi:hypothetical protein